MAELPEAPTPTLTAIYADYEARQGDGFRDHLGASIIGKSCARALWYDFRWITPARHSGRLLRPRPRPRWRRRPGPRRADALRRPDQFTAGAALNPI